MIFPIIDIKICNIHHSALFIRCRAGVDFRSECLAVVAAEDVPIGAVEAVVECVVPEVPVVEVVFVARTGAVVVGVVVVVVVVDEEVEDAGVDGVAES